MVNVQSSPFGTAGQVRCVINLAVVPAAWLEWLPFPWDRCRSRSPSRSGSTGADCIPGGSPAGRDTWWQVHDDADA